MKSTSAFQLEKIRNGLWRMIFDLPGEKVNKFSESVIGEMEALLKRLQEMGERKEIEALVVESAKDGIFIAGADIKMIEKTKTAEEAQSLAAHGQNLLLRWESLPFPTIASIQGAALGGGCEFSLACSAIVMSNHPKAKIGLPEIMLGVIPGMGGCIRMPRKIGVAAALDCILSSKQLSGDRALKMGLIEACLPKENFHQSVYEWVEKNLKALQSGQLIGKAGGMRGLMGFALEGNPIGLSVVFSKAKGTVLSKTKGHYPAPLEALKVIQKTYAGVGSKFRGKEAEWRYKREAEGFGKMAATDVSKNLIRIFYLTENVKKSTGLADGVSVEPVEVSQIGVLGAGVMGGGIAQLCAAKDYEVRMKDIRLESLETGIKSANDLFKKAMKRKRLTRREYQQKLAKITPLLDYQGYRATEFVVEAVVENMDLKKKVFSDLEQQISDDCVVASNTSSLSISEMQKAFKKPERFGGMHFFNPVHMMPLIEVIRGDRTSDQAVATIFEVSKKLGKFPIVVKDAPGFLVNRLLALYLNEATYLLLEGATITEIDQALLKFGMPMGPIELIDEVGVDVAEKVGKILNEAFGERMKPAPMNHSVVEAKRFGKKSKQGFYLYSGPKLEKQLDPNIYSLLGVKPQPGKIKPEEMVDRCVLPMINEAARCLEEQIVDSPDAVDLGMIMGTGFPPFRGGLLRYADSIGLSTVVEKLTRFEKQISSRFKPSAALIQRAQGSGKFY